MLFGRRKITMSLGKQQIRRELIDITLRLSEIIIQMDAYPDFPEAIKHAKNSRDILSNANLLISKSINEGEAG
jgi:hypothetical protein